MDSITIRKPDDWHAHLRDGLMLDAVLPFTSSVFGRAIVMPNLSPNPVITTADVIAYRKRIEERLPSDSTFKPLMTYYMTETSSPDEIARGYSEGVAHAVKIYPAHATTNSNLGVTDIQKVYPVLSKMQALGMPVLLHGETTVHEGKEVEPDDREKVFLDTTLPRLLKDFPGLKIVLEHATTKDAVDFVLGEDSERLAATITLHHLRETAADRMKSAHPEHLHCMPIIKSEYHREAIREAATSGDPHFFLGTDSAPHPLSSKEKQPPAAGIFTAPVALELYAEVFEEEDALQNFEAFASLHGPRFYGMEPNTETITLKRTPWRMTEDISVSNGESIRPYGQGLTIGWKIVS
jgi:dihydroorotase